MERAQLTAEVLVEALPYIRRYAGRTIVIKYGGHAMVDASLKDAFAQDVVLLKYVGIRPVVVHGGGPQIGKVLERMGITSTFVQGMRVTTDETMDVVEMVLGGKVNKEIVSLLNHHGGKAVGLSGKDGRLVQARKMTLQGGPGAQTPEIIDPGRVGDVEQVDTRVITALEDGGYIPVIAPVGVDAQGEALNINADLVAGRIAEAIGADRLLLLTDVAGVKGEDGEVIPELFAPEARALMGAGTISGGMIPKVACCLSAVSQGVPQATILDGRVQHSVLLELFTDRGVGTAIRAEPRHPVGPVEVTAAEGDAQAAAQTGAAAAKKEPGA
jgi:acetylglutamate kinase